MSFRRKILWAMLAVLVAGLGANLYAQPVFENTTPTGFSVSDSAATTSFVTDKPVTVRVDLNQPANATYPVIGNFQKLEKSVPYYSTVQSQLHMNQAMEIDANGIIHRAWIQQRGTAPGATATPTYGVVYAKSVNGGQSWLDTVSVSGTMTFDLFTPDVAGATLSAYSTVDLVVDSKGNPRVAYAMDWSGDGSNAGVGTRQFTATDRRAHRNVLFNYSNDGGSSWLPANNAVVVNDTVTVFGAGAAASIQAGRNSAFPRMAITSTDDIFIVYERDATLAVADPDIMLAKMDADSLKLGSAQPVKVGPAGNVGSSGGVRLDVATTINTSPDIAVGDGDVLHVVYFNGEVAAAGNIEHKQLQADQWTDVSAFGWDQTAVGATVGTFLQTAPAATALTSAVGWTTSEIHLFPTVVVDRARTPDRIYVLWKHITATTEDENIAYATANYNGLNGNGGTTTYWSSTAFAFDSSTYPLFLSESRYIVESYWSYVDRVAAVFDRRKVTSGDLHIVFSAGESVTAAALGVSAAQANALYYSRFNGVEWELPQIVASGKNKAVDGVGSAYQAVFNADVGMQPGDDNVYVSFVGGQAGAVARHPSGLAGLGIAAQRAATLSYNPFFKTIGRVVSFEDLSIPSGAYVYHLTYDPVQPQTTATDNMVTVTAAGNTSGTGIGGATPPTSKAAGGFLTGRWARLNAASLGVSSLPGGAAVGDATAIHKGVLSLQEAQNNTGVWEGTTNDAANLPEWGDDGDKVGLLVKLNVLGADSPAGGNLFVVRASSAAQQKLAAGNETTDSQSISLTGAYTPSESVANAINGTGAPVAASDESIAPEGSFFQMGAEIDIIAANVAPVVQVVTPDASTTGFANESFDIRYILYDSDTNVNSGVAATLTYSLYAYPDDALATVLDIRTFGRLIVDENDAYNTNFTGDFVEGTSAISPTTYTWDDPGLTLQASYNWAPITKTLDGFYYIYIVADDGVNPPVYDVSESSVWVRHIPLVRSISPVASDTVDTGEYEDLDKTNPYKIKFQLVDYDDDAQVRLFYAAAADLDATDVLLSGTYPSLTLDLTGAKAIELSDTLTTDDETEFSFDVAAQGSTGDSTVAQGSYYIYAVVADEDTFAVGKSSVQLSVRHSPAFEFTAPILGGVDKINSTQQFEYTIQWQRGRSDQDLDDAASIALYYTGVDPQSINFSGTDSTALLSSTAGTGGNAVLIAGGLLEDDEGRGDQYVWDFKVPPGDLPKVFRPAYDGTGTYYVDHYQHGATVDTAWVYAVLNDGTSGNTRVQAGGAILLLGSQENPASQTPRVVMRTPTAGNELLVNGDVVKLEWDSFLIDDGTGTDDAYLRLYAAPKNKYTTLTDLQGNIAASTGASGSGAKDVIIINSFTGSTDAIQELRESDPNFYKWDTKTTSFAITGTPNEFDIFIAASMDPNFSKSVYVNGVVDSVASGIGSQAQKAVLSRAPGILRVEGTDPIYSVELSPGAFSASSGDTLDLDLFINSQGSSVDQLALYLNVPRSHFDVVDQDAVTPGVQPFADSSGAFQTPSTIAQNDTTQGDEQWIKLGFVEWSALGEVIGRVTSPFDSSQVAGSVKLVVKQYSGGAPLDTLLQWSTESGRETGLYRGSTKLAQPMRDGQVQLTPRARLLVTVPLEGRGGAYSDTLDVHVREIGSTWDITDQSYIGANDATPVFAGGGSSGTLEDSVQVLSDVFGTFTLKEIPPGIYELTVKAPGYVTGRSDTLTLFNGLTQSIEPTFGSDALGNLSPATALGFLRGGDATDDNQVDIADANLIFSVWNKVRADAEYVRDADVNNDGVINSLDLGFVTKNFGNDGFGAPPVFKGATEGGDNASAIARVTGIEEVEAWWPGRVFEVTARIEGMSDVAAYGLRLTYDPERIVPLEGDQAVAQGNIFDENPDGSLFFHRVLPGAVEVGAGRIGADWSASGDADLVTVRFMALGDDPGIIDITGGELGNSAHMGVPLRVDAVQALPKMVALHQNYPNPFNPSTEIRFDIPTARDVQLRIYNQLGQTVRTLVDQRVKAGTHAMQWDGADEMGQSVASGVYFYNLEAGDYSQIRKMTLVK